MRRPELYSISRGSTPHAAEERIRFLAHHDALTRLPNRILVKDRFEQAAKQADRTGVKVALVFLDLDGFKTVNDSLGHPIGDALLKATAERLQACVRQTDTVSRQGGDEFIILLHQIEHASHVDKMARNILDGFSQSLTVNGDPMNVSFSIGIAVYPDDGHDFENLMQKADEHLAVHRTTR